MTITTTQREAALRLADELQRFDGAERESLRDEAAALLRELLAEPVINHKMTTEPAEPQGEPVRECADNDSPWLICKPCAAVGRCAKLPVAWRSKERINGEFDSGWKLTSNEPPQTPRTIAIEPLYTHPPQQRHPLTVGQIKRIAAQCEFGVCDQIHTTAFARAIERAVTGEQK